MNEIINIEKSHMHMPTISALFSLANRTYSTLTRQLEAVINKISMA